MEDDRRISVVLRAGRFAHLLERPGFLDAQAEERIVGCLMREEVGGFADAAAHVIRGTSDLFRLVLYLLSVFEERRMRSTLLDDQASARLFARSTVGWLDVYDPALLDLCEQLAHDPDLRGEIEAARRGERLEWYDRYVPLIALEERIASELDIEALVERYRTEIESVRADGLLDEDRFEKLREKLHQSTTIVRNDDAIGSLISEALQCRLGFATIHPHVAVTSRASEPRVS